MTYAQITEIREAIATETDPRRQLELRALLQRLEEEIQDRPAEAVEAFLQDFKKDYCRFFGRWP